MFSAILPSNVACFQTLIISTMVFHKPVVLGNYVYPDWAAVVGLCVALLSVLPLPFFAVYNMATAKGNFFKVFFFVLGGLSLVN